jgi:LysM repeat protein
MCKLFKTNILKKVFYFCIIIEFQLIITGQIYAQLTGVEVQRSTEKVLIDGKKYFIHTVRKSETLYSIAKAYNVTVADITVVNPGAVVEIQVNQVLRIPSVETTKNDNNPRKIENQISHVVMKGQTLYSISRIYGISVSDIKRLNPEIVSDTLHIDQVIQIPENLNKEEPNKTEESRSGFIQHKVEEKETLYSLSRQYKVSQDSILKANEEVAKNGLKAGQIIFIPPALPQIAAEPKDSVIEKKSNPTTENRTINCDSVTETIKNKNVTIALLLPFFSSGTYDSDQESVDDSKSDEKSQIKQTDEFLPMSINFIEFYQGVLLALENFKRKGIQVNLNVFDTEKGISKLDAIIKSKEFQQSNFIIGPVFPEQIKVIADYSGRNGIYMISPISSNNELLAENPFLIQVNPGNNIEAQANIRFLNPDTSKRIFVIYNSKSDNPEKYQYNSFKELLKGSNLTYNEVTIFDNDFSTLKTELDSLRENIVLSPVSDEIFISSMLSILESNLIKDRITVIGMSEWTNYPNIDLNYFFDLQFIYHSPFYLDYENKNVKDILARYYSYFGTEPGRNSKYGFNYCMLGYDIANYFTEAYMIYGKEFTQYFQCIKLSPSVVQFKFVKSSSGSYTNSNLIPLKYNKDDYKVVNLKPE